MAAPEPTLLVVLEPVGVGWKRWNVYIRGRYEGEYPDITSAMALVDEAMGEPLAWTVDDTLCRRGWSHEPAAGSTPESTEGN